MGKIRLLVLISTLAVVGLFGSFAIMYARGYRINLGEGTTITTTGLLVANSEPNGAQIFINGELKTATNNTISLSPKTYDVIIKKEGFLPWEKRLTIEKEVVTQIDAFLIPTTPSLTALTFTGVQNPHFNSDSQTFTYTVPNNGEIKAGLWALETVNLPLGFTREPRQITDGNLENATWELSPDGRKILLTTLTGTYLLNANDFTPQSNRTNIISQLETIKQEWQKEQEKRTTSKLKNLSPDLEKILKRSAQNFQFSPDQTKLMYTVIHEAIIPDNLIKILPGSSTQKQERTIMPHKTYVYDIKEDRNFAVGEPDQITYWLGNSLNLLIPENNKITITDYDGTNRLTAFSGNYIYPHAYPSSNTGKILILTNLGSESSLPNLYWLSLK